MKNSRHSMVVPPPVEKDLETLSNELNKPKDVVLKGCVAFLERAVNAESVEIYEKENGRIVKRKVSFD